MLVKSIILFVTIVYCSTGYAQDIPLAKIWAQDMPGTMNVYELEDPKSNYPLMSTIVKAHLSKNTQGKAGQAFVVQGIGLEALKNASRIIARKQELLHSLPFDTEVSVIFFSVQSGQYVHLTKVERIQNTIKIRYEFVPHYEKHFTSHVAIIPLGKLPKGHYQVDIANEPFAQRLIDKGLVEVPDEQKLPRVSSSFDFTIE